MIKKITLFLLLFAFAIYSGFAQIRSTPVTDFYVTSESFIYDYNCRTNSSANSVANIFFYDANTSYSPQFSSAEGDLYHYVYAPSIGKNKFYLIYNLAKNNPACANAARPSNHQVHLNISGFTDLFANCPNHALVSVNQDIGIIEFTRGSNSENNRINGDLYFNNTFTGNFNFRVFQEGRRTCALGCGGIGVCVRNTEEDRTVLDMDFCRLKSPNQQFGLLGCSDCNSSNPGTDVSASADGNNEAVVNLFWQSGESGYCNEVFDQGSLLVEMVSADAGNTITNLSNNPLTWQSVSSNGSNKFYPAVRLKGLGRFEVRIRIKDRFGNEYFSRSQTITVVPSCYGSPAPSVSISGPGIKVINNGYGNPLGSYRLQTNQEYTLNVGSVTDFCKHYQVSLGDGINVVPPTQAGDCFPPLAARDANGDIIVTNTGIQITEYLSNNQGFKFIPRDLISGYKIDIQKRPILSAVESNPNLGNYCPNFQPIVLTVGGQNENLTSNCLIVIAPSTIPTLFPGVSSYTAINSILQYFDYTVQSAQGVLVRSEGGDGVCLKDGANLHIIEPVYELPIAEQVDNNKNWVQSKAYDDEGRIISEGKQFFDNRGRALQNQSKNLSGGVVMATQTIYDKYGRFAITTLPAPIRASERTEAVEECGDNIQQGQDLYFVYKNDFVTNGSPYSYIHFDDVGTSLKKNNPDAVDNTIPGTLGWYYGPNNIVNATVDQTKNQQRFIEPYVAQTNYPYHRNLYLEDGSNEVLGTTLPGDQHRAGSGKMANGITTNLTLEDKNLLADYLQIRGLHVFPGISDNPTNIDNEAYRVSVKDIEQDETITIKDSEGRTLITYHPSSSKKSFTYYDLYGRVVCSIPPNGMEKLLLDKTNVTLYQSIDKVVNHYNYKGHLIETIEKDFGTSKFMYRLDGTLRYSQNDKQRQTNSFVYTIYDYANRPIESGLFTPTVGSSLLFNSVDLKLTLEENAFNSNLSSGGTKSEVIYTVYDFPDQDAITAGDITNQTFLKGKVSFNYRFESGTGGIIKTWFSYDERGRILWTAQRIPGLATGSTAYGVKKIAYTYAPNGSVKEVAYTGAMTNDNFYHVYYYNLDNRLSHVYTATSTPAYTISGELINGKLQARYSYYLNGSLKRIELAENLQGLDYTYTPQGWLKAFNYPNTSQDPGKDGSTNSVFPEDVFAMRMDYFDNDYVKSEVNIVSEKYYKAPQLPFKQYYNGNITGISWMKKNQSGAKIGAAYGYEYDDNYQLNNANYLSVQLSTGGFLGPSYTTAKFQERNITYDANGNIQTLLRTKSDGTTLHNFQYQYKTNSNQLEQVNNLLNNGVYTNYTYDAIGQLKSVTKDGTTTYVHFDNRGMLTAMTADEDGSNPIVKFYYDEKGIRYKKELYSTALALPVVTYYMHDAAKHTVAIYDNNNASSTLTITEIPIYGSDRIGMLSDPGSSQQYQYELKDHLGSVRSVMYPVYTTPAPLSFTTSFEGSDYAGYGNDYSLSTKSYPAGFTIPSGYGSKVLALQFPNKSTSIAYRRALRTGDRLTGANIRVYVPASGTRAGRLVSGFFTANGEQLYYDADRLYPVRDSSFQTGSPSQWVSLSVSSLTVAANLYDGRGNIVSPGNIYLHIYVNQTAESGNTEIFYDQLQVNITYAPLVDKSNLQGLIAYTDYYPYGLPLSDKYISGQRYRYGYQGQNSEEDPETNLNSFLERMYDPNIGRWLSVDPDRIGSSPYIGMGNNPVLMIDPDGGSPVPSPWSAKLRAEWPTTCAVLDFLFGGDEPILPDPTPLGTTGKMTTRVSKNVVVKVVPKIVTNLLSKTAYKILDGPLHHIATNKHTTKWTPIFKKIFSDAGLDIDKAPENLVHVPGHKGPHKEFNEKYHQIVFEKLMEATKDQKPKTIGYERAVKKVLSEIAADAQTVGTEINKLLTKEFGK